MTHASEYLYYESHSALTEGSVLVLQMVFSSSCTVYGNPEKVPIDEEHPLKACSPYGRTKLIIEDMFRDVAAAEPEWRTILLRYFNPVGAHPSGGFHVKRVSSFMYWLKGMG